MQNRIAVKDNMFAFDVVSMHAGMHTQEQPWQLEF